VTAANIVWTVGAMATVIAAVRLRKTCGSVDDWDWLLIPGLFGMTFRWGFLTFQFAVPIGLFALDAWYRYLRRPSGRAGVVFGMGMIGVFFSHALIAAWVMTVAALILLLEWNGSLRTVPQLIARGLPLLTPLPFAALWLKSTSTLSQATSHVIWNANRDRVVEFFPQWLGSPGSLSVAALGVAMCAVPVLGGARLTRVAAHRIPLIITLAMLVFGPHYVFGNYYTYNRFFSLLAPVVILGLAIPAGQQLNRWRLALPPLAVLWVTVMAMRMVAFDQEQQDLRRILQRMSPGKRLLAVVEDRRSPALGGAYAYSHVASWYQAQTGGLTEFSFSSFYPMLVRFRRSYTPALSEEFFEAPVLDWQRNRVAEFNYILVRGWPASQSPLAAYPADLIAHDGQWWLYQPRSAPAAPP
jgi:hypothetical protein